MHPSVTRGVWCQVDGLQYLLDNNVFGELEARVSEVLTVLEARIVSLESKAGSGALGKFPHAAVAGSACSSHLHHGTCWSHSHHACYISRGKCTLLLAW